VEAALAGRAPPIMKLCGTEMHYDNPLWTNTECLNAHASINEDVNIKTCSFFTKYCRYILLKVNSGDEVRYTVLELPRSMTLQQLFLLPQDTTLKCVQGCRTPSRLINGEDNKYPSVWIVNRGNGKTRDVRLGRGLWSSEKSGFIGLAGCGIQDTETLGPSDKTA
jgi:hypothetical protein